MEHADAFHLVRRTSFVVQHDLVDRLTQLSRSQAVEVLLDFRANPSPVVPSSVGDTGRAGWDRTRVLNRWWLDRMGTVPRPLQEHLALFWHSHFAVSAHQVPDTNHLAEYLQLLRAGGAGSFASLVRRVSTSPAMLLYLDNHQNVVGAPNENFARELLELHTLSPGNYTERDVVETARAWTGHRLSGSPARYSFRTSDHDHGTKTIFGISRNWDGPALIDEIVRGARRVASARFIARKLWSYFAYPDPSDALVDELTVPYLAAGADIGALLRAILNHDEFYSAQARFGMVRGPVHWAVACAGEVAVSLSDVRPEQHLRQMGQLPFYPAGPDGWGVNGDWLSPVFTLARGEYAVRVATAAWGEEVLRSLVDASPSATVDRLEDELALPRLGSVSRAALETHVRSVRNQRPSDQLSSTVAIALLTPEMQLA